MLKREEKYEGDYTHNHDVNISISTLHAEYEDLFGDENDPDNHSLLQSDHFLEFLNSDKQVKDLKKIITNPNFTKVIDKIKNDARVPQNSMRQAV